MLQNVTLKSLYLFVSTFILIWVVFFNTGCWEPEEANPGDTVNCLVKEQLYAAGESFKDNCNTCTCTDSGDIICTEIACAPTCEWGGTVYQAGDSFQNDCNMCSCTESGDIICTDMACVATCEWGETVYQVGESFKDDCNTCTCTDSGDIICTGMACAPTCKWNGQVLQDGQKVEDESGCGYCICLSGEMACTDSICPPEGCVLDGVNYEIGDKIKQDCNTCVCNDSGEFSCTEMACAPTCKLNGQVYQAGESFEDDCNTCSCTDTGHIVCTEMACFDTCEWNGQILQNGEKVDNESGCGYCVCLSGAMACTDSDCSCNPEEEYYRNYVANAEECAMMDAPICPEGATYFSNECGCGCEMSTSCPKSVNCMPPTDSDWCTTDALSQCPYTSVEQ